ncbi:PQQ-like beta-propeller repeat protein [Streptomyces sp. XM83C]|uniref:PQQ-like beta-propeller repeat protein n=1 Tax=Streptomyces sp. XM83C TaxID=2929781 RepID=UPI001FFB225C|nr:PQQ-like beta-propeller repeat protein [Streptomyces sp. XM83C]MCK1821903.1 PQQ-like beta-propeller repeat protein [Streptomyces sp. XM83C]
MDRSRTAVGPRTAELLAEDELPGLHARARRGLDVFLIRHGARWLVAGEADRVTVGRIAPDGSRVLAARTTWEGAEGSVSPLPDGGLAVAGATTVRAFDAEGRVRWTYPFQPWPAEDGHGTSCAADATGRCLLAVTTGLLDEDGCPGADLCVALDLRDGSRVAATELQRPPGPARYFFQHSLTAPPRVFLNALTGETYGTWEIALGEGFLRAAPLGDDDGPIAGSALGEATAEPAPDGRRLTLHTPGGAKGIRTDAGDVLPQGLRFLGRHPGFLDDRRLLVAVGRDPDRPSDHHLLLDATTLRPAGELRYPGTECPDPLPLGDGTWLTLHGDVARRWTLN